MGLYKKRGKKFRALRENARDVYYESAPAPCTGIELHSEILELGSNDAS